MRAPDTSINIHMNYRSEIDGLRAIAVIPVIFFHAGAHLFKGGFVGVDVFFVISGYLITFILLNDIKLNRLSILKFYERRARRILPALFAVIFTTIPFEWFFLPPMQLKDFFESIFTVVLFLSNFLFWSESGYFDLASEAKPLIHTWSLAIEEQFYLFFPALLIFLARRLPGKELIYIFSIAVLSLIFAEYGWRYFPSANFYLLPFRAWELFVGAIVAFFVFKGGVKHNDTLAGVGMAAIVVSIFYFDSYTPFPSGYGLVPVLGSALILLYGDANTLVGKFLSNKILVSIGLISYSLYLWHQPLIAINSFSINNKLSVWIVVPLAFVLSFFSWKYVETPFRNKNIVSNQALLRILIICSVTLLMIGLIGHVKDGFPSRYSDSKEYLDMEVRLKGVVGLNAVCNKSILNTIDCATSDEPEMLIWGDSYAMHLIPGLLSSDEKAKIQQITFNGCMPLIGFASPSTTDSMECIKFNDQALEWLEKSNVSHVVLGSAFDPLVKSMKILDRNASVVNDGKGVARKELQKLIHRIRLMGKIPVVVSPPPVSRKNFEECYKSKYIIKSDLSDCDFLASEIIESKIRITEILNVLASDNLINLTDYLCNEGRCMSSIENKVVYRRGGHLTVEGSEQLGKKISLYSLIQAKH